MEAAILDGGTRNEPIAVAPIARIERGYATPAAVYVAMRHSARTCIQAVLLYFVQLVYCAL